MIAWATLYPALLALLGELAANDDPTFAGEDRDRPRQIMSPAHNMTLAVAVTSVVGLGEDEQRLEEVAPDASGDDAPYAGQLRATITGQRRVTLQLEVDSIDNSDVGWAWAAIERIRTRIRRQSSIAALEAVDAALISVGNGLQANFRHEGRMHSRVLLELVLGVVVNDVDPIPIGWIERVELTGHIQDTDGTELPAGLNMDQELIPPA